MPVMHLSSRTTALHRGQALQATPVARGSGATHGVDARAAARSAPRADPQSTSALQQPSYAPSRSAAPSRRGVCARAELGASSSGSSSSGAKGGRKRQLPIFPLSVVALPHCQVPLMIFEARYRVLFSTLLDSMPGVDEGLVQKDSPFCGSREFGMCFVDQEGNLAAVGSTLRIQDMEPLEDGRLMVNSKGEQRFRVTSVVREKPVLICEIEEMDEPEDSESAEAQALGEEVRQLMKDLLRLVDKMGEKPLEPELKSPPALAALPAAPLSYWVAGMINNRILQQNLLECASAVKRLAMEKEILTDIVKHYAATVSLKMAFAGGSSEGGSSASSPDAPPASS